MKRKSRHILWFPRHLTWQRQISAFPWSQPLVRLDFFIWKIKMPLFRWSLVPDWWASAGLYSGGFRSIVCQSNIGWLQCSCRGVRRLLHWGLRNSNFSRNHGSARFWHVSYNDSPASWAAMYRFLQSWHIYQILPLQPTFHLHTRTNHAWGSAMVQQLFHVGKRSIDVLRRHSGIHQVDGLEQGFSFRRSNWISRTSELIFIQFFSIFLFYKICSLIWNWKRISQKTTYP